MFGTVKTFSSKYQSPLNLVSATTAKKYKEVFCQFVPPSSLLHLNENAPIVPINEGFRLVDPSLISISPELPKSSKLLTRD